MLVRLTQLDGKLPNLALMKLAAWHRSRGDEILFTRNAGRDMFEPECDRAYASAIFTRSGVLVDRFRRDFPDGVVGGTGFEEYRSDASELTVEQVIGEDFESYDYSPYPKFTGSIGFTMRGCTYGCKFCIVPKKEGRPKPIASIAQIWRGDPHPRHLHLLDNDFFGQPREQWEARVDEIRSGGFRVCFNQGINVRMIDAERAAVLASMPIYDDQFRERRIYTAWDNIGHEDMFFRGIGFLTDVGIDPDDIMAYMLIGWDPKETWERIHYRFDAMVKLRIRPYPMVFEDGTKTSRNGLAWKELKSFQRWAIQRWYFNMPFAEYMAAGGHPERKTPDAPMLWATNG